MASPPSPDDTICALSSGRPPAGIAIVRMSGPGAGAALETLAGCLPVPRVATLRPLRHNGALLDRALVLWFPGPSTATGEDVAELHVHGGIAVVDAVLAALHRRGVRLAEPGEFTRRALFNGRMDLSEVEGLADLLAAETEAQRREALLRADGHLARDIRGWIAAVVDIAAQIEAAIDFDGEAEIGGYDPRPAIGALLRTWDRLLAAPAAERLRDGLRVAIVGPANAGKSSLFNALVGADAAIVSDQPGTTRDALERPLALGGIPFVFTDTAGLRNTHDAIERIGIERAVASAASADIVLDLTQGAMNDGRRIAVTAKADLAPAESGGLRVSVVTGEGLEALGARLLDIARSLLPREGEAALTRRLRDGVGEAADELRHALLQDDLVIAAEHVRRARAALDRLVGGGSVDAVLDALFGRFCLGK